MLHAVQDPRVGHEVRRAGVAHVAELAHHHGRHPRRVHHGAAAPHHHLPQVRPRHAALGADVHGAHV